MFEITLNTEMAAVLLRCLLYGQASINKAESESGEAKVIDENIEMLRRDVCMGMSEEIIKETAETINKVI